MVGGCCFVLVLFISGKSVPVTLDLAWCFAFESHWPLVAGW